MQFMVTLAAALVLAAPATRPLLLVHYMPWFENKNSELGWHWTMGKPSRDILDSGRVASHYRPLLGPYDGLDHDVVEYQIGLIKLSGFDGVVADWYGIEDHFDYPMILERTKALFMMAAEAGLKVGIVYEDQSLGNAAKQNLIKPEDKAQLAQKVGSFLASDWLKRENWLHLGGKPAVMVFGPQDFGDQEWAAFRKGTGDISLLTLHGIKAGAQGAFDWPVPSEGLKFSRSYPERSKDWGVKVAAAYPRFHDFYEEGGQKGHPDLADGDGATYRTTLDEALASGSEAVQVATWNDWQEGTQIEPSEEFGNRDLIATQQAIKKLQPSFPYTKSDLDLPLRLYKLRKRGANDQLLNLAARGIMKGDLQAARQNLRMAEGSSSS